MGQGASSDPAAKSKPSKKGAKAKAKGSAKVRGLSSDKVEGSTALSDGAGAIEPEPPATVPNPADPYGRAAAPRTVPLQPLPPGVAFGPLTNGMLRSEEEQGTPTGLPGIGGPAAELPFRTAEPEHTSFADTAAGIAPLPKGKAVNSSQNVSRGGSDDGKVPLPSFNAFGAVTAQPEQVLYLDRVTDSAWRDGNQDVYRAPGQSGGGGRSKIADLERQRATVQRQLDEARAEVGLETPGDRLAAASRPAKQRDPFHRWRDDPAYCPGDAFSAWRPQPHQLPDPVAQAPAVPALEDQRSSSGLARGPDPAARGWQEPEVRVQERLLPGPPLRNKPARHDAPAAAGGRGADDGRSAAPDGSLATSGRQLPSSGAGGTLALADSGAAPSSAPSGRGGAPGFEKGALQGLINRGLPHASLLVSSPQYSGLTPAPSSAGPSAHGLRGVTHANSWQTIAPTPCVHSLASSSRPSFHGAPSSSPYGEPSPSQFNAASTSPYAPRIVPVARVR